MLEAGYRYGCHGNGPSASATGSAVRCASRVARCGAESAGGCLKVRGKAPRCRALRPCSTRACCWHGLCTRGGGGHVAATYKLTATHFRCRHAQLLVFCHGTATRPNARTPTGPKDLRPALTPRSLGTALSLARPRGSSLDDGHALAPHTLPAHVPHPGPYFPVPALLRPPPGPLRAAPCRGACRRWARCCSRPRRPRCWGNGHPPVSGCLPYT